MRHDGRAENADRDVEHCLDSLRACSGINPTRMPVELGLEKISSAAKQIADRRDESDDERLDIAKAFVLQIEHEQHIERGDDAAPDQRNAEEQLQRDRRADDLRQIAGSDRDLAKNPEKPDRRCE